MAGKPPERNGVISLIEVDDEPAEKGTLVADLSPLARRVEMRHHIEEARQDVNDDVPTMIRDLEIDVVDEEPSRSLSGARPAAREDSRTSTVTSSVGKSSSDASLWLPLLFGVGLGLVVLAYLFLWR